MAKNITYTLFRNWKSSHNYGKWGLIYKLFSFSFWRWFGECEFCHCFRAH